MLWYALHVRSNSEHQVTEKLDGAGIEGFYPFVSSKSKDGRREIEKKFMPGYVFSRFDLANKTPVVAIEQVVQILGWGRHAVSIPEHEIEAVRKIVTLKLALPSDFVNTGDRVLVRRGPLAGMQGWVSYVKNATRIVVSIEMLARSISAEVDAQDLELLPQQAAA